MGDTKSNIETIMMILANGVWLSLVFLLGFFVINIQGKKCPTDKAEVKIFPCKDLGSQKVPKSSKIKASHAKTLHDAGYTKCLLPFGILIVANGTFKDDGLLSTAKIVAELVDQDRNGVADNPSMVKKLRNTAYLVANDKEFKVELSDFITNYFEVDKFWSNGGNSKAEKDRIRIEEVFHLFTQYAYGLEKPNVYGGNIQKIIVLINCLNIKVIKKNVLPKMIVVEDVPRQIVIVLNGIIKL